MRKRGYKGYSPVEGTVVIMDLDRFSDVVTERGWSEYSPNPATALLTRLVEEFARKWQGVVVYGLDEERGTEEAVIEIPFVEPEELLEDLTRIKQEINKLGIGITIVAVRGYVLAQPAPQREAYTLTPTRRQAHALLRKLKRRRGNTVVIV